MIRNKFLKILKECAYVCSTTKKRTYFINNGYKFNKMKLFLKYSFFIPHKK